MWSNSQLGQLGILLMAQSNDMAQPKNMNEEEEGRRLTRRTVNIGVEHRFRTLITDSTLGAHKRSHLLIQSNLGIEVNRNQRTFHSLVFKESQKCFQSNQLNID